VGRSAWPAFHLNEITKILAGTTATHDPGRRAEDAHERREHRLGISIRVYDAQANPVATLGRSPPTSRGAGAGGPQDPLRHAELRLDVRDHPDLVITPA